MAKGALAEVTSQHSLACVMVRGDVKNFERSLKKLCKKNSDIELVFVGEAVDLLRFMDKPDYTLIFIPAESSEELTNLAEFLAEMKIHKKKVNNRIIAISDVEDKKMIRLFFKLGVDEWVHSNCNVSSLEKQVQLHVESIEKSQGDSGILHSELFKWNSRDYDKVKTQILPIIDEFKEREKERAFETFKNLPDNSHLRTDTKNFLQIGKHAWIYKGTPQKRADGIWVLDGVLGPGVNEGAWAQVKTMAGKRKKWKWTYKDQVDDDPTGKSGWIYEGEKPTFKEGKGWTFISDKPLLEMIWKGELEERRFYTAKSGKVVVQIMLE